MPSIATDPVADQDLHGERGYEALGTSGLRAGYPSLRVEATDNDSFGHDLPSLFTILSGASVEIMPVLPIPGA